MVADARTEEGLVELWRRVVDPEYARSIEEADDAGMDVVRMQASQLAALDARQLTAQQSYYLLPHSDQQGPPASGIAPATGVVQVERSDTGTGVRTIKAGVELEGHVTDSMGVDRITGYYRVVSDVTLAAGDLGPVALAVEAVVPGVAGNQPAGTITRFATRGTGTVRAVVTNTVTLEDTIDVDFDLFNEGEQGQFLIVEGLGLESYPRLITNVSQGTPTIVTIEPPLPVSAVGSTLTVRVLDFNEIFLVEQEDPTTGGLNDTLDAIGAERNQPRALNESDESYRQRLSRLPDVNTPNAIVRIATRILEPYGIRFHFAETRAGIRGFVLDDSPLDTGEVCSTDFWAGSVLLNENDSVRFFVICVSAPDQLFGDAGKPLDNVLAGPNAYDSGGPGDGAPVEYNDVIALLWRTINSARLAGVNFRIVQDPEL